MTPVPAPGPIESGAPVPAPPPVPSPPPVPADAGGPVPVFPAPTPVPVPVPVEVEGSALEPEPAEPVVSSIADSIVLATLSVPSVSAMHGGAFGQVATHLPGRRVTGVRLSSDVTEVHVVARMGSRLTQTAADIRTAVSPLAVGRVDVFVEDVDPG